jgi:hypothetical protein
MTPAASNAVLDDLQKRATRGGGGHASADIDGWHFVLGNRVNRFPGWHLSVSYRGIGMPTLDDWKFLSHAAKRLGAPEGSLLTPVTAVGPEVVHHWAWDVPPDLLEGLRDHLLRGRIEEARGRLEDARADLRKQS